MNQVGLYLIRIFNSALFYNLSQFSESPLKYYIAQASNCLLFSFIPFENCLCIIPVNIQVKNRSVPYHGSLESSNKDKQLFENF